MSRWNEFYGSIEATELVELRPRVSGYIERVDFQEGREVNKDDELFEPQRAYSAATLMHLS